jgi:hypothetical protein
MPNLFDLWGARMGTQDSRIGKNHTGLNIPFTRKSADSSEQTANFLVFLDELRWLLVEGGDRQLTTIDFEAQKSVRYYIAWLKANKRT